LFWQEARPLGAPLDVQDQRPIHVQAAVVARGGLVQPVSDDGAQGRHLTIWPHPFAADASSLRRGQSGGINFEAPPHRFTTADWYRWSSAKYACSNTMALLPRRRPSGSSEPNAIPLGYHRRAAVEREGTPAQL